MQSEAACLTEISNTSSDNRHLISCAGGSPGRAYFAAEKLIENGASRLISFGICGAMDPTIRPGHIALPSHVINPQNEFFAADPGWRDALSKRYSSSIPGHAGSLMTTEIAVSSVAEKRSLHQRTGASTVDMESASVGAKAAEANIPFIVIRAAADPAERALPQSALVGLAPNGNTRSAAVINQLARRPWEFVELLRLGKDSAQALEALRRVALLGF